MKQQNALNLSVVKSKPLLKLKQAKPVKKRLLVLKTNDLAFSVIYVDK